MPAGGSVGTSRRPAERPSSPRGMAWPAAPSRAAARSGSPPRSRSSPGRPPCSGAGSRAPPRASVAVLQTRAGTGVKTPALSLRTRPACPRAPALPLPATPDASRTLLPTDRGAGNSVHAASAVLETTPWLLYLEVARTFYKLQSLVGAVPINRGEARDQPPIRLGEDSVVAKPRRLHTDPLGHLRVRPGGRARPGTGAGSLQGLPRRAIQLPYGRAIDEKAQARLPPGCSRGSCRSRFHGFGLGHLCGWRSSLAPPTFALREQHMSVRVQVQALDLVGR